MILERLKELKEEEKEQIKGQNKMLRRIQYNTDWLLRYLQKTRKEK